MQMIRSLIKLDGPFENIDWSDIPKFSLEQNKQQTWNSYISKDEQIFWAYKFKICLGCSKEWSHWDGSFEYPQHMF